ncbi:MAG: S41 family peptidase [Phycisphaerales bacterium]|nr:hypothetical protein [Planctomycetota bacterium]
MIRHPASFGVVFLGIAVTMSAQAGEVETKDVSFLIEYVERNYAGFSTKLNERNREEYTRLTGRLREQASIFGDAEIASPIRDWLDFFRDRHLTLESTANPVDPLKSAAVERLPAPWTAESLRAHLEKSGSQDSLEGIWSISGSGARVAILRRPLVGDLEGSMIDTQATGWEPGDVKLRLRRSGSGIIQVRYWPADRRVVEGTAIQQCDGNLLSLSAPPNVRLVREWPKPDAPFDVDRVVPSREFFVRRVSPTTLWVRFPDFLYKNAAAVADLLESHRGMIESTPNLIIDIRNNGGGDDNVYRGLLALTYTRPIYKIGVEYLATEQNIQAWERWLEIRDRLSPESKRSVEKLVAKMRSNVGAFVGWGERPFSIERFDSVMATPRRIGILIDHAKSSGEQFVLEARQSRKTTLFGRGGTDGVLDFANVRTVPLPSGKFLLHYPTSRSMRLPDEPVDPAGIGPDIRIPESEEDDISFVQRWLERQVD